MIKDPQKQLRILVRWALDAITRCDGLNSDAAHTAEGITLKGLPMPWTRETLESLRRDFRVIRDAMGDNPIWNKGGQGWRAARALKRALPAEPGSAVPSPAAVAEVRRWAEQAQEAAHEMAGRELGTAYDVDLVWQAYPVGGPRLAEFSYRLKGAPTSDHWHTYLRADCYGDETVEFRAHLLIESWCMAYMNDDPDERKIIEEYFASFMQELRDAAT